QVTGFPTPACDGQILTDPETGVAFEAVPILVQGTGYDLTINVFENYGNGNLCPVDSATVAIFDEIQDIADEAVTDVAVDGVVTYTTIANLPSTTIGRTDARGNDRSYQKPLTVIATVGGQTAQVTEWVLVTGDRPRTGTFITAATQEMPTLILRDPPGDASSAFLEQGTSFTAKVSNAGLISRTLGIKTKTKAGIKFEAGTPFFSTSTSAEAENEFGFEIGLAANLEGEMEITTTTTERFSTSDSDIFTSGDGDIYLGFGLNLVFAKTDVLDVDEDNCQIVRSQTVRFGGEAGNSFDTIFLYTDLHVRGTLIPQLRELAELVPDSSDVFNANADTWEGFLALNDSLKAAAPIEENRSFSAGAEFETETTSDTTSTFTYSISVFSKEEAAAGFEFESTGSGGFGQFTSVWEFDYTYTDVDEDGNFVTVGYNLSDDDVGDYFSVDIGTDPAYGTPVFHTVSGRSSCPWEPNTQPRDSLAIAIEPPVQTDVPIGEVAAFTLSLTNFSASDELREYVIIPVQESNPGGAILRINGNAFGSGQSFFIDPGQTQEITLTVAQGPRRFLYEDIELLAIAPCEFERFQNGGPLQLEDRVRFTVSFAAPCSDIRLFEPVSGWAFNIEESMRTNDSLSVTLKDFELQIGDDEFIEAVGAEYMRADTDDWFP
ncbi:MAG: hypothetical protein KDA27_28280, partial [Candidatus Eisenbacteria bacterium]|nr:hypothetical protein [Candidatus Eisenbacteria bacterium]